MSGPNNLPPVQQYMGYHGNQDPQLVEQSQLPPNTTASINSQQNLAQHQHQLLQAFWGNQLSEVENGQFDFRVHQLPLARIKKVMKTDEDVKMISAEAPIIFAKSCEIMILELTLRAWIHAEENKRRTLQRSDIAAAISKTDMFDFLIDIVPREDSSRNSTSAIKSEKVDYRSVVSPEQSYQYAGYPISQYQGSMPHDQRMVDPVLNYQQQQQLAQIQYAKAHNLMMQQQFLQGNQGTAPPGSNIGTNHPMINPAGLSHENASNGQQIMNPDYQQQYFQQQFQQQYQQQQAQKYPRLPSQ